MAIEGQDEDSVGDRNIRYLDCINIKILVVILYDSFTRCCPGGIETIQGVSLYYFLQMHANLQLSQNRKFN